MSASQEGPNPLRPYYRPLSIGVLPDSSGATNSGTHGLGPKASRAASYASSARDMFSDLDYSDYLSDSSPSSIESIRKTLDAWMFRYMGILLSHPFDAAKTVLQVRNQGRGDESVATAVVEDTGSHPSSYRDSIYSDVCWSCQAL